MAKTPHGCEMKRSPVAMPLNAEPARFINAHDTTGSHFDWRIQNASAHTCWPLAKTVSRQPSASERRVVSSMQKKQRLAAGVRKSPHSFVPRERCRNG
jgi:hypothetical protein